MLALNNDNSFFIYKVPQENISNKYVRIFGNLEHLSNCCLDWIYTLHNM